MNRVCGLLVFLLFPSLSIAQSVLQYTFKAGEHFTYHYKLKYTANQMTPRGGTVSESSFECDPDWLVEDLDMNGLPTIQLTVRNRTEKRYSDYVNVDWARFPPQSHVGLDRYGKLLYGKILVDGPERKSKDTPDSTVIKNALHELWYAINDTLHLDTTGNKVTVKYDTEYVERDEKIHRRGEAAYVLTSETLDSTPVWHLHSENAGKYKYPAYSMKHNSGADTYFRKEDGLIQRRHYTLEWHTGYDTKVYEAWLDLISFSNY
jgi:hypothetical protein